MKKIVRDKLGRFLKGAPSFKKNKIKKLCLTCSKEFETVLSRIKSGRGKYCSNKCYMGGFKRGNIPWNKGMKGIHLSPETEWKYKNGKGYRHWVFKKFGTSCVKCKKDFLISKLQVHHKDKNRENNTVENLMIVCRLCHLYLHKK